MKAKPAKFVRNREICNKRVLWGTNAINFRFKSEMQGIIA